MRSLAERRDNVDLDVDVDLTVTERDGLTLTRAMPVRPSWAAQ